jgi:hypothetical protein
VDLREAVVPSLSFQVIQHNIQVVSSLFAGYVIGIVEILAGLESHFSNINEVNLIPSKVDQHLMAD